MVRPFLWLCTENWNSLQAIKLVLPSTHILLLSGLRDELVPPGQMKQLWEIITEKGIDRRVWHDFVNGTHSAYNVDYPIFFVHQSAFQMTPACSLGTGLE